MEKLCNSQSNFLKKKDEDYNYLKSISFQTKKYNYEAQKMFINKIKKKYEYILLFINLVIKPENKKINKLTDFKKINKNIILKNNINNVRLLKKYYPSFLPIFNLNKINIDKIDNKYIIKFIKQCLKNINYILVGNIEKDTKEKYYSIYLDKTVLV